MKRIFSLTLTAACAMPMVVFGQSSGQQTYDQACSSCHETGTAGGDKQVAKPAGGGGKSQQQAKASGGGAKTGGMPSAEQILKSPGSGLQIQPQAKKVENPYAGDKNAIATGETLFNSMNCSGCHAPEAGSGMGPALTDVAWIYGDAPADLYITISTGRPNGMPAYGNMLPQEQIWQLVSYIETLQK